MVQGSDRQPRRGRSPGARPAARPRQSRLRLSRREPLRGRAARRSRRRSSCRSRATARTGLVHDRRAYRRSRRCRRRRSRRCAAAATSSTCWHVADAGGLPIRAARTRPRNWPTICSAGCRRSSGCRSPAKGLLGMAIGQAMLGRTDLRAPGARTRRARTACSATARRTSWSRWRRCSATQPLAQATLEQRARARAQGRGCPKTATGRARPAGARRPGSRTQPGSVRPGDQHGRRSASATSRCSSPASPQPASHAGTTRSRLFEKIAGFNEPARAVAAARCPARDARPERTPPRVAPPRRRRPTRKRSRSGRTPMPTCRCWSRHARNTRRCRGVVGPRHVARDFSPATEDSMLRRFVITRGPARHAVPRVRRRRRSPIASRFRRPSIAGCRWRSTFAEVPAGTAAGADEPHVAGPLRAARVREERVRRAHPRRQGQARSRRRGPTCTSGTSPATTAPSSSRYRVFGDRVDGTYLARRLDARAHEHAGDADVGARLRDRGRRASRFEQPPGQPVARGDAALSDRRSAARSPRRTSTT